MSFNRIASMLLAVLLSSNAFALKVGLVLDKGGRDDKSFNAAAFAGATKAEKELKGVTVKTVEAKDDNAFDTMLRGLAGKDFDLIIGIGFAQMEALGKVAKAFPNKKFGIIDAEVKGDNVRSMLFEEHQGSFLVGAMAALMSKNGAIGFIGGMDIPLIRRFGLGYVAGARHVNKNIKYRENFVGSTSDAWNNPAKAKELALAQYNAGADVIFAAAGASNAGLFDAAEDKKKLAIGVDSNQNWVKPGYVLTSMMKRVDVAVFELVKDSSEGKFSAGTVRFGLKNQGVDYAMDEHNAKLVPADVKKKVDQIKADIIAGKVDVPDYYKKK